MDDDPDTCETVSDVLDVSGYAVVVPRSGDELFTELARTSGPRVALLDWQMPHMSGDKLVAALRAHDDEKLRATPVIIFSAARPLFILGADAHLEKPFSVDRLLSAISRVMR
jgi:DNA-binding response OmpR family regulator